MKPFDGTAFEAAVVEGLAGIDVESYRRRVVVKALGKKQARIASVDIDAALREDYPASPRWDYGVWYELSKPKVAFIEAHKAESGEVELVLKKQRWLKDLLVGTSLPPECWYWLVTGKILFPRGSSYYRRLASAAIILVPGRLDLQ